MEKRELNQIIQDLKAKRDALSLAHEELKRENDSWNKCVIIVSLTTGMFESMKLQMRWNNNIVLLVPIGLSSIIAMISALIKFKNFPNQMEIILQSQSLITHTLNVARNEETISPSLLTQYHESLEKLETSIYPDMRKKYMKASHTNLISIYKQEKKFYNEIDNINKATLEFSDDSSSDSSNPFQTDSPPLENIL
jgi:hypothetical protein